MAEIYEDERLARVEEEKAGALQEVTDTFSGAAEAAGELYDKQAAAVQNYADQQAKLQQEQTDLTIEQIEQQKEQAQKDYIKEQSGAYTDYQKQTAQHGVQAEQMAAGGLNGTGFSETSKMIAYNAYQNRVAVARESYNQVVMNYNNGIKEAKFQNSSALAEIAFNALQQGLQLSMQQLQHLQQLKTDELGMKLDVDSMYHGQYMDVLGQINTEKAQAEQIRQFDLSHQLDVEALEEQKAQNQQAQANWQAEFDESVRQNDRAYDYQVGRDAVEDARWKAEFDESVRQSDRAYDYQVGRDAVEDARWKAEFDESVRQSDRAYDYQVGRDAVEDAQWQKDYELNSRKLAQQEKLEAASVLAAAGDFSGYKDALGLTDAQVKKLEAKYQEEIKTEADEKAYEKEKQAASIMAAAGDFSGYQKLFGLTDAQVKKLEEAYGAEVEEEIEANTKELTGTDRMNWENRFAMAGDERELEAVVEEMLAEGYKEDDVWELYWGFTTQPWQSGSRNFNT